MQVSKYVSCVATVFFVGQNYILQIAPFFAEINFRGQSVLQHVSSTLCYVERPNNFEKFYFVFCLNPRNFITATETAIRYIIATMLCTRGKKQVHFRILMSTKQLKPSSRYNDSRSFRNIVNQALTLANIELLR